MLVPQTRALRFGLVAVHIALAFVIWHQATTAGGDYDRTSDVARYRAVVTQHGTPYRDFDVEYPPVALAVFKVLGPSTFDAFLRHLLLLNMALHVLIVALLFKVWGERAGWAYLVLSAALMPIVYTRFDLVVVAIAVIGAALVRSGRPVIGALCWTAGAFTKLWPAALLPSLAARGRVRAFVVATFAGAVGVLVWVAWAGGGGPKQVLTYRGARGWEFESVPGSLLRLVTRGSISFEQGSWRVGAPPAIGGVALGAAIVAFVAWQWVREYRVPAPEGVREVAVITALLVGGNLLSPQFVIWLVPFAAIAAAAGAAKFARATAIVVVLTLLQWATFDVNHVGATSTEVLVLARNAALIGLLVVAVRTVTGHRTTAIPRENGAWSPAPSPAASPTRPARTSSSMPTAG